jgi:hypothetical protein
VKRLRAKGVPNSGEAALDEWTDVFMQRIEEIRTAQNCKGGRVLAFCCRSPQRLPAGVYQVNNRAIAHSLARAPLVRMVGYPEIWIRIASLALQCRGRGISAALSSRSSEIPRSRLPVDGSEWITG